MRRKHGFYGAPSALALALALGGAPAFGQDAAQSGDAEQLGAPAGADAIVVTGTRITSGSTAPTPVTVQTADELLTSAPGTLADGLNQLPQFRGSDVPQAGGVSANGAAGANLLNLRNLGAERNLVLLNGRRVVAGTDQGATDINTLPQSLVSRVEVVTGGASAAYGSDAVAGVVNFILDTEFEGLKGRSEEHTSELQSLMRISYAVFCLKKKKKKKQKESTKN